MAARSMTCGSYGCVGKKRPKCSATSYWAPCWHDRCGNPHVMSMCHIIWHWHHGSPCFLIWCGRSHRAPRGYNHADVASEQRGYHCYECLRSMCIRSLHITCSCSNTGFIQSNGLRSLRAIRLKIQDGMRQRACRHHSGMVSLLRSSAFF